ncbi:MAG: hypothetical protein ACJAUV_000984 [Flavobacteriales bacterium]|jgi:hypothetical protein
MKNMKLMMIAAMAIMTLACSKEEIKEEANNFVNETAAMTAIVDGTQQSFLGTNYSESTSTNLIAITGSSTTGQAININFYYENRGDTSEVIENVTFVHFVNTVDPNTTFDGNIDLTAWNLNTEKMSGTFNFKYFNGTDSVFVENGVFTEVGK